MQAQRILITAFLTAFGLFIASQFLQSPYQLWCLMACIGVITGLVFKTGQRHVITGFGLGIAITLFREIFTYGISIIELTGLVYAAGYLFAIATSIAVRTIALKLTKPQQSPTPGS